VSSRHRGQTRRMTKAEPPAVAELRRADLLMRFRSRLRQLGSEPASPAAGTIPDGALVITDQAGTGEVKP
jgi:hypothetical protein